MITKKQKIRTVILIVVLAIVIIAGVFGISFYMGGYQAPWVLSQSDSEAGEEVVEKPVVEEPKKEEVQKPEKVEEPEEKVEEAEPEATGITLSKDYGYYGALSVDGTHLVDSNGKQVQLIGVSSHGLSWYPEYINEDSIKFMKKNLGLNVVRLAMYTSDYNGYCVGDDNNRETLKQTVYKAIDCATANDMYVIVDWHILNDSNPNEYKQQAIQFFGETVRKYAKSENVIYEICNEPNGDTTWEDISAYANEVIPVIRNVDKDAIILVGTPNWSSDLESVMAKPLEYENIMYTYHFYASTHKAKNRNKLMDAVDSGIPVFISEFGFTEASGDGEINEKEAENWIEVIQEYNLSACIWNLSNKDEASALIAPDCERTSGWAYEELSAQGKFIYDYLTKLDTEEITKNDN